MIKVELKRMSAFNTKRDADLYTKLYGDSDRGTIPNCIYYRGTYWYIPKDGIYNVEIPIRFIEGMLFDMESSIEIDWFSKPGARRDEMKDRDLHSIFNKRVKKRNYKY